MSPGHEPGEHQGIALPSPVEESAPERIYPEDCGFYLILAGPFRLRPGGPLSEAGYGVDAAHAE